MVSTTRNCPKTYHPLTPPDENQQPARKRPRTDPGEAVLLPVAPTSLSVRITLFPPPPFARRIELLIANMPEATVPTTDQALSLWEEGKYIESIELCNRILREAPSDSDFLVFTIGALALQHLGDWENCVDATQKALTLYPCNYFAWILRSNALRMQNKLGPSLIAAELAVYHSPTSMDAHHARTLSLQYLDRGEEAKTLLNEIIEVIDYKLSYLHEKRRFLANKLEI